MTQRVVALHCLRMGKDYATRKAEKEERMLIRKERKEMRELKRKMRKNGKRVEYRTDSDDPDLLITVRQGERERRRRKKKKKEENTTTPCQMMT